ncbi:thioredoxin-related protein [Thiohalobacter thiocyanaticus]|uniref:Thioredoxin-related protein n=1 Tax=Thiohalobacter thiocyanaticus TaxID=585455 RepID=A0A1Z4VSG5_9GAMM|nr:thioredoxin fold domain-containing protein [Thiohalobacter thiocyanaticus]BAZ94577.1 thioredoxin-related protein [Thiohalobacter thiocyanaticus]
MSLQPLRTLAALLLGWPAMLLAAGEGRLEEGMVNPGYHEHPAWFKQSFLDLPEDVQEAAAADKRLLLYFYQDGCPYCKKLLETNFSLKDIVDKTRENFDVLALNMWGDREVTSLEGEATTEKRLAEKLEVMYTPTLIFLDEQGNRVLRLNGYYPPHQFQVALDYVAGGHEREMSIQEFAARQAPAAASGRLHTSPDYLQPPYDLSGHGLDKPLLVLFEQKECPACDELHTDILERETSRELIDRFDVVLLDMQADTPVITPAGRQTTARKWSRELGVKYAPSLVFFDGGEEVFRAEAYLRAFHIQSVMDYVASRAYQDQPNLQRFIQSRADRLEAQGVHVDLMD